jgi:Cof subfamily protein (haloacid dehalogenase superfamily)
MIRLIALDLDQTLFGSDLAVAPPVREAISRAMASGVCVTIATGREARLAAMFAKDLGITKPIICAQGGCIYDPATGRTLHDVRLSVGLVPDVLAGAEKCGWNIHFEVGDRLYFPPHSKHPPELFELIRYSNWARVADLLTAMPEPPNKFILTLHAPEDRARVMTEVRAALGDSVAVVASHPYLVEGLPAGVNKAHGLAWLAEHLGVSSAEVLALGDSQADVPMLEWAGVGVAMGNASPEAKAAADWIAPSLQDHGAAAAILKYLYPQD